VYTSGGVYLGVYLGQHGGILSGGFKPVYTLGGSPGWDIPPYYTLVYPPWCIYASFYHPL